ncbi:stage II sporulation protein R [Paenibacillus algicola]|uniref:Stage II sporulation protein R n=1 Tax=Paenibacillus algicola TaxID=2565926 RepID=A0A4P8XQ30_9BACL|nr:stage II sporulation protein R [Paenibacillus algicola]QCT04623.1 stage II sporulation protein R [Paenibacillus algicola]
MQSSHPSRDPLRTAVKQIVVLLSILFLVVMSWEEQRIDAAVTEGAIPEESIRLRILAHSDAPEDQLVKQDIRDAVVMQMKSWVGELAPESLEQAKAMTRNHLPEIEALVAQELDVRGITYAYQVELGEVPFPTKMYGRVIYPAGDYEAVRITLGSGKGKNWWCVLFPPLCFIGDNGDVSAPKEAAGTRTASAEPAPSETAEAEASAPEVRFFLLDLLASLWSWVSGLFK